MFFNKIYQKFIYQTITLFIFIWTLGYHFLTFLWHLYDYCSSESNNLFYLKFLVIFVNHIIDIQNLTWTQATVQHIMKSQWLSFNLTGIWVKSAETKRITSMLRTRILQSTSFIWLQNSREHISWVSERKRFLHVWIHNRAVKSRVIPWRYFPRMSFRSPRKMASRWMKQADFTVVHEMR